MTTCPLCRHPIESTALATAFNDPPGWSFWGEPGARWKVCEGPGYLHIRVQIDGRMYHRQAQITKAARAPTPATRPAKKEPTLPLFEQRQEDWLL